MKGTYRQFIKATNEVLKKKKKSGAEKKFKDIGRKGAHVYILEDFFLMRQSNMAEKVFRVESLKKIRVIGKTAYKDGGQVGKTQLRIGYYMLSPKSKEWTWGQSCPIISPGDLRKILERAKKKGMIKFARIG